MREKKRPNNSRKVHFNMDRVLNEENCIFFKQNVNMKQGVVLSHKTECIYIYYYYYMYKRKSFLVIFRLTCS